SDGRQSGPNYECGSVGIRATESVTPCVLASIPKCASQRHYYLPRIIYPGATLVLQFFEPVHNHIQLRWCSFRFAVLDHEKSLAVGGNIVPGFPGRSDKSAKAEWCCPRPNSTIPSAGTWRSSSWGWTQTDDRPRSSDRFIARTEA